MTDMRSPLADGLQAVYDGVIGALKSVEPEVKYQLLCSAVDILGKSAQDRTSLKLRPPIEILALVADIPTSARNSDWPKVVQQFLWQFTDRK
jgi:hypothetical protein